MIDNERTWAVLVRHRSLLGAWTQLTAPHMQSTGLRTTTQNPCRIKTFSPFPGKSGSRRSVAPHDPRYVLKRVWLTKEEEAGYYYGFANEGLWPLCHVVFTRPHFELSDWTAYARVNQKFAQAVLREIQDDPAVVWIQDYHFALLPRLLKEARPDLVIAQFWHIPWPNPEAFRICPWKQEILWGLLANDLLGFHIRYHCDNFLATVDRELEVRIDRERLSVFHHHGIETLVRPFPISTDIAGLSLQARSAEVEEEMRRFRAMPELQGATALCWCGSSRLHQRHSGTTAGARSTLHQVPPVPSAGRVCAKRGQRVECISHAIRTSTRRSSDW